MRSPTIFITNTHKIPHPPVFTSRAPLDLIQHPFPLRFLLCLALLAPCVAKTLRCCCFVRMCSGLFYSRFRTSMRSFHETGCPQFRRQSAPYRCDSTTLFWLLFWFTPRKDQKATQASTIDTDTDADILPKAATARHGTLSCVRSACSHVHLINNYLWRYACLRPRYLAREARSSHPGGYFGSRCLS